MRLAAIASALAIVLCVAVFGAILQKAFVSGRAPLPVQAAPTDGQAPAVTTADAPTPAAAPVAAMTTADAPPPAVAPVAAVTSCAGNPNALRISRVVEIDTTRGPRLRFQPLKSPYFLPRGQGGAPFRPEPLPQDTPH